jgi:pteridine reductase
LFLATKTNISEFQEVVYQKITWQPDAVLGLVEVRFFQKGNPMEPTELKDKVILITGGAIRLGKAMALHAARLGMHVAITYHTSVGPAEETRAEIEALGRQCFAIRCDQSQADEIQPTVSAILARFGQIDVLVNSASNFEQRDFFDVTPEGWDNVINTNARGPFFFSQHCGASHA